MCAHVSFCLNGLLDLSPSRGSSINMKMWGAGKPKTKPRRDSKVYKYVFADQFFVTVQPKCGMPPTGACFQYYIK